MPRRRRCLNLRTLAAALGVLGVTWAGTAAQRPNVSQCRAPTTEVKKVITARSVAPGFPWIDGLVNDRGPRPGPRPGNVIHRGRIPWPDRAQAGRAVMRPGLDSRSAPEQPRRRDCPSATPPMGRMQAGPHPEVGRLGRSWAGSQGPTGPAVEHPGERSGTAVVAGKPSSWSLGLLGRLFEIPPIPGCNCEGAASRDRSRRRRSPMRGCR